MTNTSLNLYIRKVNGCSNDIGLRNFFRNFFIKKKKATEFFILFFIFHESSIKTFRKWSINKFLKGIH